MNRYSATINNYIRAVYENMERRASDAFDEEGSKEIASALRVEIWRLLGAL